MNKNKLNEFGEYLKTIRKEKGLSIRKLEELSGVSNAYLSQLENGKRGIPSPEILKKINIPLGVEYRELMEKAGYIDLHKETVYAIKNNDLDELLSNAADIFLRSISENEKTNEKYKDFIIKESQNIYSVEKNEIEEMVNEPDFFKKLFDNLTPEEKISFLDILIKDFAERNIDTQKVLGMNSCKRNTVETIKVPILGHIAAGIPITANEHIEEWTEIPNMWNLKDGEVIVLRVKGDSMIGSRIFDGDKVVVKLQSNIENGEIAVVNVNGDEATLKRVKKSQNGQTILYPDNPKYEPIIIANEGARIIGKVIQVMFEPR